MPFVTRVLPPYVTLCQRVHKVVQRGELASTPQQVCASGPTMAVSRDVRKGRALTVGKACGLEGLCRACESSSTLAIHVVLNMSGGEFD